MKRLHRYVFTEVLIASSLAVLLFVFILLAGNVLRDLAGLLASGRVGFLVSLRLTALLIPYVVAYALPLGVLTGVMIAMGRISSNQELTAMRTAGLSLFYLSAPVFLLAGIGVFLAVGFNFYYTPVARTQYKEILAGVVRDNPLNFLRPREFIKAFPGYVIYIGERSGEELRDFWIWEMDDDQRVDRFIRAERGTLRYEAAEEALVLTLQGGVGELRRPGDPDDLRYPAMPTVSFREFPIRLPLEQILGRATARQKLNTLTFHELMAEWNRLRRVAADDPAVDRELIRAQIQIHHNFAMGFSIFSLAIVAVPLAIKVGRKETYANFALALSLALTFYFLMMATTWLENRPEWRPDLLAWLPNILFQSLGLWLLIRANQR